MIWNAFSLWKPEAVKVTKGAEHIGMYRKTENSERQYCTKCGGHLMTAHPVWGLIDVYAAILPSLTFEPGVHVHYAEPPSRHIPKRSQYKSSTLQ